MPEDMDIYMKKIKQRADETDNVMGKIKADKMAELDKLRIDNEMEEVRARLEENRAKIRESQQTGQTLAPQQAYNFAEFLFAGRPPEEIKQIISTLTQEEIQKLAYMASAMNTNKLTELRDYMRQPSTSMKEVVEAIKIGTEIAKPPPQQSQGSISDIAKSMAEMFKTGVEVGRGQTQQQPQQPQDPMQIYKAVAEIVRPYQDDARAREKEANELRHRELESKIVNPADYIKNIKAMASDLGLTGGGKTEMDLKLEEMKQNRETDNRKIELEEKKWEYEKQNEGKTLDTITSTVKEVLSGPIGKAIENLGAGAADRVRGGSQKTGNMTQVQCPSCKGIFAANPNLAVIGCPQCGAKLEKQQAPSPTPPIIPEPEPTPQPEQPKPEPERPQSPNQTIVTNIVDLNRR